MQCECALSVCRRWLHCCTAAALLSLCSSCVFASVARACCLSNLKCCGQFRDSEMSEDEKSKSWRVEADSTVGRTSPSVARFRFFPYQLHAHKQQRKRNHAPKRRNVHSHDTTIVLHGQGDRNSRNGECCRH